MSGDFLTDHADSPYEVAMVTCVVLFGWRCVRKGRQDVHFISPRLVLALLVMVPAVALTLHRWDSIPRDVGAMDSYALAKIREAKQPMEVGFQVCLALILLHTLLWIFSKPRHKTVLSSQVSA